MYSNQLTHQAMANLYHVELVFISSLDPEGRTVPRAVYCRLGILGHYLEDEGIQYVCLVADNEIDSQENENQNIAEDGKEFHNGIHKEKNFKDNERKLINDH